MAKRGRYQTKQIRRAKPFRLAPRVKRVLTSMAEKKHHIAQICDVASLTTEVAITGAWQIYNLNCSFLFGSGENGGIVQGTNFNQRIGERISILSNEMVLRIVPSAVNNTNKAGGSQCRVVIFLDKEPHSAATSATALFNIDNILAEQNLTTKPRYQILKDFVHVMVPLTTNGATTVASGPVFLQKIKINKKYKPEFTGTGGTTSAYVKNCLFMAIIADANACCSFVLQNQMTFIDE